MSEDTGRAERLKSIIERMATIKVAVIGDAIDDVYHFGDVVRLAPEAPVPVFVPRFTESRPGGAANVARQLEAFGCFVYPLFGFQRSTKSRYMVGHQILLRVDEDRISTPLEKDIDLLIPAISRCSAVVLSDYAKGWLTPAMCRAVIEVAKKASVPVIVDPKGTDWAKYTGASLICPNEEEYRRASAAGNPGRHLALLVKQGPRGMTLSFWDSLADQWEATEFPAKARNVYDVTGAGDTVVATVAAAVAAGGNYEEAAELAILTSGYVVGEVGTSVCPKEVLCGLLES